MRHLGRRRRFGWSPDWSGGLLDRAISHKPNEVGSTSTRIKCVASPVSPNGTQVSQRPWRLFSFSSRADGLVQRTLTFVATSSRQARLGPKQRRKWERTLSPHGVSKNRAHLARDSKLATAIYLLAESNGVQCAALNRNALKCARKSTKSS